MPILSSLALRIGGVVLIIASILLIGSRVLDAREHRGYQQAVNDGLAQKRLDDAKAKEITDSLRAALRDADDKRFSEKQSYEIQIAELQRRARAGTLRLYCPATGPVSSLAESGNRSAATGSIEAQNTGLMPEATATILGIAGNIAQNVRDYNALKDRFEKARLACMGQTIPSEPIAPLERVSTVPEAGKLPTPAN